MIRKIPFIKAYLRELPQRKKGMMTSSQVLFSAASTAPFLSPFLLPFSLLPPPHYQFNKPTQISFNNGRNHLRNQQCHLWTIREYSRSLPAHLPCHHERPFHDLRPLPNDSIIHRWCSWTDHQFLELWVQEKRVIDIHLGEIPYWLPPSLVPHYSELRNSGCCAVRSSRSHRSPKQGRSNAAVKKWRSSRWMEGRRDASSRVDWCDFFSLCFFVK